MVRSTSSSCITTSSPSRVEWTSDSITASPYLSPSRKPRIVSSGTTAAPPRWMNAIGQSRGVGGLAARPALRARTMAAAPTMPASMPRMKVPALARMFQTLSATTGKSPCCLMMALLTTLLIRRSAASESPLPGLIHLHLVRRPVWASTSAGTALEVIDQDQVERLAFLIRSRQPR